MVAAYEEGEEWLEELNRYLDESLVLAVENIREKLPRAKAYVPQGTYVLWVDFFGYGYAPEKLQALVNQKANVARTKRVGPRPGAGGQLSAFLPDQSESGHPYSHRTDRGGITGGIAMNPTSLAQRIEKAAHSCGLDQCGIIPVDDLMGFGTRLEERMEKAPASAGFYGNMARLEDIKAKYPWGRSIVVCTFDFSRYQYPQELQGRYGKSFFLSPEPGGTAGYDLTRFEEFLTETGIRWEGGNHVGHGGVGPLRYEAVKAGLGIIRKNNFFYTENGSYVSLFSYLIDQPCTLIHHPDIPPCARILYALSKGLQNQGAPAPPIPWTQETASLF